MKNRIRRAMDAHLSCLNAPESSRAAIWEKVRGGKTVMKKKASLGFVLALALALVVIGALAAVILTHKEFVDQVLSPKASENVSESWTQEEMDDILRMAAESGVALDQQALARIKGRGDQYKEEVMRLFAKAQLGFYPSTWSIEDQAWYDQMLVDSGLKETRELFVPEGNEISQQQALDIALAHILSHFDKDAKVTDETLYRRHLQYAAYSDNPHQKGKQWMLEYEALAPAFSSYTVTILSDGTVKEANRTMGLAEAGRPALDVSQVLDLYRDTYGGHDTWTMETWLAFQKEAIEAAKNNPGAMSGNVRALLKQSFALPDDSAISREAAIQAAAKAVAGAGGPEEKALLDRYRASAVYFAQGNGPIWRIAFQDQTGNDAAGFHAAELDAYTGQPRYLALDQRLGTWAAPYISSSNPAVGLPAAVPDASQSMARPDGTPKLWHSGAAPDYYWKALDAVGYNADTAGKLMNGWTGEYGEDTMFWPLEAQAIDAIWHILGPSATVLPGLPAQGDMARETAVELAWQAFRQAEAGAHDDAWFADLKTAVSFTFNTPGMGDRQWVIRFVRITPTASEIVGYAALDAITGEVEGASWASKEEAYVPAPSPTLRPDGRPALWYSDRAPASFWQELDAVGYTAETAAEMEKQWAAAYGEDPAFWPLKQSLIYQLWHSDMSQAALFPALPGLGDMAEEDALALAWETAHREYDAIVGADLLSSLKAAVYFQDGVNGPVQRVWSIFLMEKSSGEGVFTVEVLINAQTGEVFHISASRSNG